MNEDVFKMSLRKFIKGSGITAQREVENRYGRRPRKAA
jgi:hypothetical protein